MEEWEQLITEDKTWSFCRTITSKNNRIEVITGSVTWTPLDSKICQYEEKLVHLKIYFSQKHIYMISNRKKYLFKMVDMSMIFRQPWNIYIIVIQMYILFKQV